MQEIKPQLPLVVRSNDEDAYVPERIGLVFEELITILTAKFKKYIALP